jgi:hypothetical protein
MENPSTMASAPKLFGRIANTAALSAKIPGGFISYTSI